jgi:hypothetical protein
LKDGQLGNRLLFDDLMCHIWNDKCFCPCTPRTRHVSGTQTFIVGDVTSTASDCCCLNLFVCVKVTGPEGNMSHHDMCVCVCDARRASPKCSMCPSSRERNARGGEVERATRVITLLVEQEHVAAVEGHALRRRCSTFEGTGQAK